MCVYIYTHTYTCYIDIHKLHTRKETITSAYKERHTTQQTQPNDIALTNAAGGRYRYSYRYRFVLPSYTRSPLQDSRLFGPRPWEILAATNEHDISEQPSPWRKSSKRESCYGDRVYTMWGDPRCARALTEGVRRIGAVDK